MRSVKFKKFIPLRYMGDTPIKGTGCWENDFTHDGQFHEWGSAHEESECGFGNYTVALVETPDGVMEEVIPSALKFDIKYF